MFVRRAKAIAILQIHKQEAMIGKFSWMAEES